MVICSLFTRDWPPALAFVESLKRNASDHRIILAERDMPGVRATLEKPKLLRSCIARYNHPALWLDADTIVRRPLDDLARMVESADLTILHRPNTFKRGPLGSYHACTFNTGVVGVNATDAGMDYLDRWQEVCEMSKPAPLLDQEAAYLAYRNLRSRVRMCELPGAFNDARFSPASSIWHGKGSSRRHILFKLESARYAHGWPVGGLIQILQWARKAEPIRRAYATWWQRREASAAHQP